ncbi:ABC transporter ATP-binding protein [Abyssisolibacter fermentans]|uniref:ABC transporter ATP-binding protein n=1 Tax=Abyssisolibacter fermentans TaxID=1766203 RepID=UPI0008325234|nr:ABC transporter ATP-binding protein [Abyssisolibacter fermentans]
MNYIISTNKLTKKYKNITAVHDVTINIQKGKFYAIMGHSGSGKTTLLNMLGLLDSACSGEIFIDGQEVSTMNNKQKSFIRMQDFGFVFQEFYLNPKLKAYENVMVPMYINPNYRNENLKEKAVDLLTLLGLKERYNHFPNQMSGGEKQRVAIARALANDPKCILADEPTGNLDVSSEKIVFDYLKMLTTKGKSIIAVSHNDIVLKYADKMYYMTEGSLKEEFI